MLNIWRMLTGIMLAVLTLWFIHLLSFGVCDSVRRCVNSVGIHMNRIPKLGLGNVPYLRYPSSKEVFPSVHLHKRILGLVRRL